MSLRICRFSIVLLTPTSEKMILSGSLGGMGRIVERHRDIATSRDHGIKASRHEGIKAMALLGRKLHYNDRMAVSQIRPERSTRLGPDAVPPGDGLETPDRKSVV